MHITCPVCSTKFMVEPEQIGKQGRKVRCSKCAHIWYGKLENDTKVEPVYSPMMATEDALPDKNVNLPILLPLKIPSYVQGFSILLIGMIVFMSLALFPNIFDLDAILNTQILHIQDLRVSSDDEVNKIKVSYTILNVSNKKIKAPKVRIRLFDENDKIIKSQIDDYSDTELAPSQQIIINNELVTPSSSSTKNIEVTIGNKLDFILN